MTPTIFELTRVFMRIGLLSFGGPAAQIAVMQRELVDDRPWISEQQFLRALSFCMLLPGPEAMQLCTYSGWRLRGVLGGLIAGLLFVLPGAIVMFALCYGYALWGQVSLVEAIFKGIQAAIVIIVLQALLRLARKALRDRTKMLIASVSFVALFAFHAPFPVVILVAAVIGFSRPQSADLAPAAPSVSPSLASSPQPFPKTIRRTITQLCLWSALWALPLIICYVLNQEILLNIGIFFSKLAAVSFGGAYAVLAYMAQEAVHTQNWLTPEQMMDGLGLAETTPGPLILVTQFVGFMAGFGLSGFSFAIAATLMTLWVTFVPCFLWIFTAAPHVEWLTSRPRLATALSAISAAVVGVIANLSLWFSLHVFFDQIIEKQGLFSPPLPVLTSLDMDTCLLAIIAALLVLRFKFSLMLTLVIMGLSSVVLTFIV